MTLALLINEQKHASATVTNVHPIRPLQQSPILVDRHRFSLPIQNHRHQQSTRLHRSRRFAHLVSPSCVAGRRWMAPAVQWLLAVCARSRCKMLASALLFQVGAVSAELSQLRQTLTRKIEPQLEKLVKSSGEGGAAGPPSPSGGGGGGGGGGGAGVSTAAIKEDLKSWVEEQVCAATGRSHPLIPLCVLRAPGHLATLITSPPPTHCTDAKT